MLAVEFYYVEDNRIGVYPPRLECLKFIAFCVVGEIHSHGSCILVVFEIAGNYGSRIPSE